MAEPYRTAERHEPSPSCADAHCHWHDVDEPGPGYIICGECGHLYRTRWALLRAYWSARWQMRGIWGSPWWVLPSRVYFCQECSHDF